MPTIQFWYESASNCGCRRAVGFEAQARLRNLAIAGPPLLIGATLGQMGVIPSPFNIYPTKGRYKWRDAVPICDDLGRPPNRPAALPPRSLRARIAWTPAAAREGFGRAVFATEFGDGKIGKPDVLASNPTEQGDAPEAEQGDAPGAVLAASGPPSRQAQLCEATVAGLGIFGAPILIAADRRGNDRREQALDWAVSRATRPHRLIVLDRRP